MTDKKNNPAYIPFKVVLYALSLLYGLVIFFRSLFYRVGIFRQAKVPLKVISVGNMTLGGTGKTPFVVRLANILEEDIKRNVCVLIRGYGWDEQAMLKKKMTEIPVLVGEDRAKSAHKGIKLYGSDTAILDDGFQHWELKRDLDIVLVDSRNPFGNGHLFPRGILREPKAAMRRADVAVFTKVDKKLFDISALKKELNRINGDLIFLETAHAPRYIHDVRANKIHGLDYARNKTALLLSSIGDPDYFGSTAKDIGVRALAHLTFPDHHDYIRRDIDKVIKICDEKKPDIILTTEKDIVKLTRLGLHIVNYPTMVLVVEIEILKGREELVARLHSLYNS